MAGRRPIPTQLKAIKGTLRADRRNPAEPQPARVIPDCPRWLDAEARREWRRVAPLLLRLGVLTEVDGVALAAYCDAYADWRRARLALREKGQTYTTATGYSREVAEVETLRRAKAEMLRFMVEFGLTPASRTRLHAAAPAAVDPIEEMIARAQHRHA